MSATLGTWLITESPEGGARVGCVAQDLLPAHKWFGHAGGCDRPAKHLAPGSSPSPDVAHLESI
jgi:hypothetical protein